MIAEKVRYIFVTLRQGLTSLIPVLLLLIYTIIGALLFYYIEGPNERNELKALKQERAELLENTAFRLNGIHKMKPLDAYNHTINTLRLYNKRLGITEVSDDNVKWTWWGAVFYALTVYTTIGYGNIYPVTTFGRVVTIIYAFIGIPLALICLIGLGGLFARICKFVWMIILKTLEKSTKVVSNDLEKQVEKLSMATSGSSKDSSDSTLLSFPVSFLIGLTVLWVLICAALFLIIEEQWNYGTSLYFTLISFTTIGFGDILPSKPNYMMLVGFCLLIGLALVSTVLTIIQQQIEALASKLDSDIDKEYKKALNEAYEGGVITEEEAKLALEQMNTETDQTKSLLERSRQPKLDEMQLDAIISRMPLKSRLMYHAMSNKNRNRIAEKAENRRNVRITGTQTDRQLLQSLIEEYFNRIKMLSSSPESVTELCDLLMKSYQESDL